MDDVSGPTPSKSIASKSEWLHPRRSPNPLSPCALFLLSDGNFPRCHLGLAPLILPHCTPDKNQAAPMPAPDSSTVSTSLSLLQAELTRLPLPLSTSHTLQSQSPRGAGPSLQRRSHRYRREDEDRYPGPAGRPHLGRPAAPGLAGHGSSAAA